MKVLITHAYARDNKGDAAILSVLLLQLQKAFSPVEINISIFDDTKKSNTFENHALISNYMYYCLYTYRQIFLKLLYSLFVLGTTILWACIYRATSQSYLFLLPQNIREESKALMTSDLIVPIGGGYFRAKSGFMETVNLLFVLHPILIAAILKKPIVLYTQTIGPFATPLQKYITRIVLNKTKYILIREDKTLATLKQMGVHMDLVVRSVDAGFLFKSNKNLALSTFISETKKISGKTLIGITVRKWLDSKRQHTYEREIAACINQLTKDPTITVIFIPQVSSLLHGDDDRTVATRIIKYIRDKHQVINITEIYDHHEIKELYAKLDYLIGTRFHSVIFALTASTPALAIEYEYKTSGIMEDLGLSQWVILIEDVTADRLLLLFHQLVKEKEQYLSILHTALPKYIEKTEENIKYFHKAYISA